MDLIAELLAASERHAGGPAASLDGRPSRHLAVVTCMDARIDALAVLGLPLGAAHVIRNAGARVTEDVLRSLALSVHVLGVDAVVVMQHTRCGLLGVTNDELRARTGADFDFLPIGQHSRALDEDLARLTRAPFLAPLRLAAGLVYDVDQARIELLARWERAAPDAPPV